MSRLLGAAMGAGKAETSGKSASAAAQGIETFIGYGWKQERRLAAVVSRGAGSSVRWK